MRKGKRLVYLLKIIEIWWINLRSWVKNPPTEVECFDKALSNKYITLLVSKGVTKKLTSNQQKKVIL